MPYTQVESVAFLLRIPIKYVFFPVTHFILNIISDSSLVFFFQNPKETNLKTCHNSNEKSGLESRNNNVSI